MGFSLPLPFYVGERNWCLFEIKFCQTEKILGGVDARHGQNRHRAAGLTFHRDSAVMDTVGISADLPLFGATAGDRLLVLQGTEGILDNVVENGVLRAQIVVLFFAAHTRDILHTRFLEQFEKCFVRDLDGIRDRFLLSDEADVNAGIGAGQTEDTFFTGEEGILSQRVIVGLGTSDAGDLKTELAVGGVRQDSLTFTAGATELEHIA